MAKKKEDRISEEELEMEIKKEKSTNSYQKKKVVFKVVGWVMAVVMLIGSLMGIFGMLAYLR